LQLALSLYPYIVKGSIVLHEPDPPFDKLPKTCGSSLLFSEDNTELIRGRLLVSDVEPSKDTSTETPIISQNNVAVQQLVPDVAELPPEDFSLLAVDNNIDADSQKVNLNTKTTQKTYKIIFRPYS
jgi:twitching motility two-component system response regulator PilG